MKSYIIVMTFLVFVVENFANAGVITEQAGGPGSNGGSEKEPGECKPGCCKIT